MFGKQWTASEQVVQAVAETTNSDPIELSPLYETIDSEALDSMMGRLDGGRVSFTYEGVEVTVRRDGDLSIDVVPDPRS